MRILVVEDEKKVARFIKKGLVENNYVVDIAPDGEEGLFLAETGMYDAIILDLMLPKVSGLDILKRIRRQGKNVPVICLTAKGKIEDKIEGFSAGSDDYLVKPFRFAELLARLRAILRRSINVSSDTELKYTNLTLNKLTRQAKRGGETIVLTSKEYSILEYLMLNVEQVITRTMIAESAWDYSFDVMSNVIDVHIRRLREKIDGNEKVKLIHTIRGMGYVLKKDSE